MRQLVAILSFVLSLMPAAGASSRLTPTRGTWIGDPYCEMVFFAVLEGLYRDGVPNAAVELVLAVDRTSGQRDHFVYACPLCSPALEAFRLYRQRPMFEGLKSPTDTLGHAFEPALLDRLRSEVKQERLDAVQGLIQAWVQQRLEVMRLTPEERQEWSDNLALRKKEGMARLGTREDWKNCAICDGTVLACRRIRQAPSR
jgi:hypothetical protein